MDTRENQTDELFSTALDEDTRDAALAGLDLARLNDARFRVVMELIDCILKVQDELADQWSKFEEAQRPELRDLQATSALVATGYARQQRHERRQIIVNALRGSPGSDLRQEPVNPIDEDDGLAALRLVALLVPRRVCEEELGDALELIARLQAMGAPRWQLRLKVASAVFWVLINGVRHIVSAFLGREKSKSK